MKILMILCYILDKNPKQLLALCDYLIISESRHLKNLNCWTQNILIFYLNYLISFDFFI